MFLVFLESSENGESQKVIPGVFQMNKRMQGITTVINSGTGVFLRILQKF